MRTTIPIFNSPEKQKAAALEKIATEFKRFNDILLNHYLNPDKEQTEDFFLGYCSDQRIKI
jgi:hypothetical protein